MTAVQQEIVSGEDSQIDQQSYCKIGSTYGKRDKQNENWA